MIADGIVSLTDCGLFTALNVTWSASTSGTVSYGRTKRTTSAVLGITTAKGNGNESER